MSWSTSAHSRITRGRGIPKIVDRQSNILHGSSGSIQHLVMFWLFVPSVYQTCSIHSWLNDAMHTNLRAAVRKWHKTDNHPIYHNSIDIVIHLHSTIPTSCCNQPKSWHLYSIFTDKVAAINSQFSDSPTQRLSHTSSELLPLSFSKPTASYYSFTSFSEDEVSKFISSHPTSCPVNPFPKFPTLLHAIAPTIVTATGRGQCFINYGYIFDHLQTSLGNTTDQETFQHAILAKYSFCSDRHFWHSSTKDWPWSNWQL